MVRPCRGQWSHGEKYMDWIHKQPDLWGVVTGAEPVMSSRGGSWLFCRWGRAWPGGNGA